MKNLFFILQVCLISFIIPQQISANHHKISHNYHRIDFVNPMIGTDYNGHTFPGATAPFGMVQLSPDSKLDGWQGCSAYHYAEKYIYGFSHTHLSGTGCSDYGDILFMPVGNYGNKEIKNTIYRSKFSHKNETASPGYYSVLLDDNQIFCELTAGRRIGIHKYHFPKGTEPQLIVDLDHRDKILDFKLNISDHITGFRRSQAWARDQIVYFYSDCSLPIKNYRLSADGKKALITFDASHAKNKKGTNLIISVGISSVSVDNAKLNLHTEIENSSKDLSYQNIFTVIRKKTENEWENYLSKIDVFPKDKNGKIDQKKIRKNKELKENLKNFYTAMYHSAIAPNLYSDVNGEYRGMDRKIHKSLEHEQYTVFSLWDTFRALHPLLTIIEPDRTQDFIYSMLCIYRESGKLPIWELSRNETDCMIGFNSVPVITDAIIKGVVTENIPELLDAMIASSEKDEYGIKSYRKYGYVRAIDESSSVSRTLEYAYDDWCIAQTADFIYKKTKNSEFAKKYKKIRNRYLTYAQNYKNVFDPSTNLMRPKINGKWLTPFDPREVNNHYTEANSWQYSFFVPQDINGHIALMGGDKPYTNMLDALFSAPNKTVGRTQVDISGLVGQYAHGNEPSHHVAYLYNFVGQPWKTQKLVRHIMKTLYHSAPDGLCGNDDCGQMSAWYVMSAIGLYSVTPGTEEYILGSPIFKNININTGKDITSAKKNSLNKDHIFHIICNNNPQNNIYISSIQNSSKNYTKSYITYQMLKHDNNLLINMSDKPNKEFGKQIQNRPHRHITLNKIELAPTFDIPSDNFKDSIKICIYPTITRNTIYYKVITKDKTKKKTNNISNNNNNNGYYQYTSPFYVKESSTIRAYSQSIKGTKSLPIETYIHQVKHNYSIKLFQDYNPQYSAGGDNGIIDGKRGRTNWKAGGWQGYQNTDFIAIVDLKKVTHITKISAGFLQDVRSWIWMPKYVDFYISVNGKDFIKMGRINNHVKDNDYEIQIKDFKLFIPQKALLNKVNSSNEKKSYSNSPIDNIRYIKIVAKNYGTIPNWHLGAGGEAFIFIDEIFVK
ncbi:MAG: GH92 family glycosyl hydrolase [Bacteroidales bacterium]